MNKVILTIDMPTNCLKCKLKHDHECSLTNRDVIGYYEAPIRPAWCPLKSMPKRDNGIVKINSDDYSNGFTDGWNSLLDISEVE